MMAPYTFFPFRILKVCFAKEYNKRKCSNKFRTHSSKQDVNGELLRAFLSACKQKGVSMYINHESLTQKRTKFLVQIAAKLRFIIIMINGQNYTS